MVLFKDKKFLQPITFRQLLKFGKCSLRKEVVTDLPCIMDLLLILSVKTVANSGRVKIVGSLAFLVRSSRVLDSPSNLGRFERALLDEKAMREKRELGFGLLWEERR